MKRLRSGRRGMTLVDTMVSIGLAGVLGALAYSLLTTGTLLFAKNTAINMAHQQARIAIIQMENHLHSSVSLPQLCDINRSAVTGFGPAAGISFQLFAGGPFKVVALAPTGQSKVKLALGSFQPKAGQRLIIPTHHIEIDISQNCPGSGDRDVSLVSTLPRAVEVQLNDGGTFVPVNVIAFVTDRVSYVVNNGELRYYASKTATQFSVMANNITSAAPFSTPQTPAGAPYYRFVAAINLSTSEPSTSNRGFRAANMYLNAQVPCRTRLCAYQ